jgi:methylglutaconyl-CoA hydratase
MRACEVPVVAAAHGAAIAGACALLAGADVVVADQEAKLGYPVVRLGISPAVSAPTLAGAIGPGRARERLLDPGLIDGREGHRIGLVHELAATREEVLGRAREIALGLAGKPRGGVRATKRWLIEIERRMGASAIDREGLEASLGLVGSEEQRRLLGEARATRPDAGPRPGEDSKR